MINNKFFIKNIMVLCLSLFVAASLVACEKADKPEEKISVDVEKSDTNEDYIEVQLSNPEKLEFDRITLSYSTSSVSPPPDGRDVYNFIKVIPMLETDYKIVGMVDEQEVLRFEFTFKEISKEPVKLSLVRNEEDKLKIVIEDEISKKMITEK